MRIAQPIHRIVVAIAVAAVVAATTAAASPPSSSALPSSSASPPPPPPPPPSASPSLFRSFSSLPHRPELHVIAGPSVSAPPAFLAGASMVLEAEDVGNHRFTYCSEEVRYRLVWTTTARSNFKHLLYNARKNTQKVCQSADPTLLRERTPTWMWRDYWESLCNIWAAERWQQTSTTMKVNRAANLEANMHTSGSVSFATHQSRLEVFDKTHKKKGTNQYVSNRAREVVESYSQQMTEKYAEEEEQPQLDPEVWVAASGARKKGHVYGFGHSMDTSRTSAFTTLGAPGTLSEMMGFILDTISILESRLAQTMESRMAQMMQVQVSNTV
ncbi:hypothetical protein Taro_043460 [Colocasia esculenta]|uniref:Uncharacterized protein n=1 Tax=Colocasia esculenta TaxID=4460 RepID=A0A843WS65_COLES|nr:hypothetical protein [Colocasia esculenta]